jgi:hypothetical protein
MPGRRMPDGPPPGPAPGWVATLFREASDGLQRRNLGPNHEESMP